MLLDTGLVFPVSEEVYPSLELATCYLIDKPTSLYL